MTPERVRRVDAVLAQRQPDLTVFAENLHKPKNFSAMVRNCDAVGINEMHVSPGENSLRTHWKTSQGAEKWVYIRTHNSIEESCTYLKSEGFRLVAAHLSDERSIFEMLITPNLLPLSWAPNYLVSVMRPCRLSTSR